MCRGGNGQDGNGQGWEWAGVVMGRMVMGRGGNGQGWEWAGVGMGRNWEVLIEETWTSNLPTSIGRQVNAPQLPLTSANNGNCIMVYDHLKSKLRNY